MPRNPILRNIPYKVTAQDVQNRVMEHLAKLPHVFWGNQFNLFDSHDVPRLHNNPKVHPGEYRGAVIFQFLLPGAASIYYGDEAAIGGTIDTTEGCRYPMPWSRDFTDCEAYRLNRTLAHCKAKYEALRSGGMKFLYADDGVVAMARFLGEQVLVGVISVNDTDVSVRLPLGAVGASAPVGREDLLGTAVEYTAGEDGSIRFTARAHTAYLMECR
jgi:alpha-glucosidase